MPDAGFLKDAGHDPASPAVFDGNTGEWLTRGELTRRVKDAAARLAFPGKALVLLFAANDVESLVAYLAALQAGHAVAMLNPDLDDALRARLISIFQPDFIAAPGQALLRTDASNRCPIHPDLALLISTSGSTGSPKLVRLSWSNLESNARQIVQALRHTGQDRTMVTAPIFSAYGSSLLHTMLLAGGSFALTHARVVSREFWDVARQAECNVIGGTPFFYQTLDRLDVDWLNVPRIRKFLQAGGAMPEHLARKFHDIAQARGGELHLMYGQAEAAARISTLPPELLPDACASVGFALPGGELWIEAGELIYRGPNVMMGYATRREDLGKGDELGGVVATGDLGYRDHRGLFYITGRKSRFVKLYGWRVSLDEVEQLLAPATVAAVNHGDRLLLYAEQPGAAFSDAVDRLAGRLNLHRAGFEIRAIDALPRLANGKIDYQSLTRAVQAATR